jgi:DNA mismatch endonuclease (patch repair protein)
MVDTLTPEQRSERMSRIRGRDTQPELVLRRALHAEGLRYRLHDADLPGKPDLVFPRFSAVVFVHGCFWHQHVGCKVARVPQSNLGFWRKKFEANRCRDRRNVRQLRRLGWRVAVVWECQLSTAHRVATSVKRVRRFLRIDDDDV